MATVVQDSFTGTDATALSAHTGETGATWTGHPSYSSNGNVTLQSNRVTQTAPGGADGALYASGVPSSADYDVQAGVYFASTGQNTRAGITARMSTLLDTMYLLFYELSDTRWELRSRVAGVNSTLGLYGDSPSAGVTRTAELSVNGTSIKAIIDGVERISATDSAVTVAGRAGVWFLGQADGSNGQHLNDFLVTDASGGAASNNLFLHAIGEA